MAFEKGSCQRHIWAQIDGVARNHVCKVGFHYRLEIQSQTKMIINNILFHLNVDIIYFIKRGSASGYGFIPWLAYVLAIGYFSENLWHIHKMNESEEKKYSINFVTCEVYRNSFHRIFSFELQSLPFTVMPVNSFLKWIAPLCKYQ